MPQPSFNDFLSEKQKLEDFLDKLDIEINACLEDFERVNLEKLFELNDMIKDNTPYAVTIGKKFSKDYIKFQNEFDYFVTYFDDLKRFTLEVTLEEFLDTLQMLKKDLYNI